MNELAHRQTLIRQQLESVREIYARHGFDTACLEELAPLLAHFEIRVPLIGAFSSGKSSLLNALLGEPLLATAVAPETAVPAELRFSPERRLFGCLPDGNRLPLTEDDLRENRLTHLLPTGWVEAGLPNPVLAAWPQLTLVDLPGWESGIAAHEQVIDAYIQRSLAYGVVISVEEGALRDSLRRALLELAVARMPVILIVSKADLRPPEDVKAVVERLRADISALMGVEPLAVAITSARKKNLEALKAAFDALQGRAAELFESRVVETYRHELEQAIQRLTLLANQENRDAERIQADIDKLAQDMRAFDTRLQQETAELEARIGPILGAIRLRVENALAGRVEMLTQRALNGQDISDDILGTARLVIMEALQQEFEPTMQRYLGRLVDALPSRLDFSFDLGALPVDKTAPGEGFRWKVLGAMLVPILAKIPHPLAKIVAPLLPILGHLLDTLLDQNRRALEEARRREEVKNQVMVALSDAVRQIEVQLRPVLSEQVRKLKEEVARRIEAERSELEKTLATLIATLKKGEAETAALRQRAEEDRACLQAFLDALGP